jgi:hypothetical protein
MDMPYLHIVSILPVDIITSYEMCAWRNNSETSSRMLPLTLYFRELPGISSAEISTRGIPPPVTSKRRNALISSCEVPVIIHDCDKRNNASTDYQIKEDGVSEACGTHGKWEKVGKRAL